MNTDNSEIIKSAKIPIMLFLLFSGGALTIIYVGIPTLEQQIAMIALIIVISLITILLNFILMTDDISKLENIKEEIKNISDESKKYKRRLIDTISPILVMERTGHDSLGNPKKRGWIMGGNLTSLNKPEHQKRLLDAMKNKVEYRILFTPIPESKTILRCFVRKMNDEGIDYEKLFKVREVAEDYFQLTVDIFDADEEDERIHIHFPHHTSCFEKIPFDKGFNISDKTVITYYKNMFNNFWNWEKAKEYKLDDLLK